MKKKCNYSRLILKIAHVFEIFISLIVLFAILLGSFDLVKSMWNIYVVQGSAVGYEQLNSLLGYIILLVIGIELVIMFSLHLPAATLLEVLTFAIAYKIVMIPKAEGMSGVLFGVAALAGIFTIKKYLITDSSNNEYDPIVKTDKDEDEDDENEDEGLYADYIA